MRTARCLREIIIGASGSIGTAHSPSPVFTLGDSLGLDSECLNGRFRSGPSYDHPAVSGSPFIELRAREFVVALLRELRPLMRGLGSRAAVQRQTIDSCVRIWRMYNDGRELPRTMALSAFNPGVLFLLPPALWCGRWRRSEGSDVQASRQARSARTLFSLQREILPPCLRGDFSRLVLDYFIVIARTYVHALPVFIRDPLYSGRPFLQRIFPTIFQSVTESRILSRSFVARPGTKYARSVGENYFGKLPNCRDGVSRVRG